MTALEYFAPQLVKDRPVLPTTEHVPLHAVIVYDRLTAGIRGRKFLSRLGDANVESIDLRPAYWRLDAIDDPIGGAQARRDLLQADMVIFAMDEFANRSASAAPWFVEGLSSRTRTLPLVVNVSETEARAGGPESPAGRELSQAAGVGWIDLPSAPIRIGA